MKEGWKYVSLENVIEDLRTGLNPRTHFKLNTPNADGYYITVRELKGWEFQVDKKTDRIDSAAIKRINERSHLRIGDVLYSGTGTIGNTAIVTEEPTWWNIKEGVYALTPKKEIIDSFYLVYVLNKMKNHIMSKSSGTTIKSIPMKELRKIQIPLPSLSEQQRIVTFLDTEFAKIDALKAKAEQSLQNAKDLFQAALKEMMEPKEGWTMNKVGDVFRSYSGGTPLKQHKEYYEGGDIPWLRSGEVCQKYITSTEMFITKEGMENSSAKYYPVDTVVIAMYGATAAQVGILKKECTSNQAVCGLLPNTSYNPEFVYYWFCFIQDDLASKAQGGAQPNISQIKIKNELIPDISVKEQDSIVSTLSEIESKVYQLQSNYTRTLQLCADLKQSLLKQVFE